MCVFLDIIKVASVTECMCMLVYVILYLVHVCGPNTTMQESRPTKARKSELLDLTPCDLQRSRLTRYLIEPNKILLGISIIAHSR